ncbi:rolling circle replication-associated protein [Priestia megaterium]|uniref:rolling circle replication-associated protein n=1 Tax=Priestia megaterium TaxID=1404 RepID=UPI002877F1CC|nr:hypothetical protein [Priestia megaterium]
MKKRKLNSDETWIHPKSKVKVTTMNHIVEVQYLSNQNTKQNIQKLDSERYVDLDTGEIKNFDRTENRSQGLNSLRKTFRRLRELINTNFVGSGNELFITLTYRPELQTSDTKQVYNDYVKFMKRLKYKYRETSTIDYINVLEPHASGKFHMHVLMRFNDIPKAYIKNEELAKIWGNGFVKVNSLEKVDNIGAYVTAYLTDLEVPTTAKGDSVKEKEVVRDGDEVEKKKFIKGGRLHYYPTGVNIYRKSKGIEEPLVEQTTYKETQKKLGAATPNHIYGVELIDDENNFKNTIIKEQYNLKRK